VVVAGLLVAPLAGQATVAAAAAVVAVVGLVVPELGWACMLAVVLELGKVFLLDLELGKAYFWGLELGLVMALNNRTSVMDFHNRRLQVRVENNILHRYL
jgi:hypothetical protein